MAARAPLCAADARSRARGALRRLAARRHRRSGLRVVNLLTPLPDARTAEQVATLLTRPGLRVERIVSLGQASAPGFWYEAAEGEWVLVVAGSANLRLDGWTGARLLRPG